ncbi:FAD-dependent oxidoreductase [Phycicoccus sp. BSK3Z-2]|uniref:FAD-dependent oxidoreductase n=1 Tax=Phycicoccus avicenniae TaxID=2828860 RepID=A0A941D8B8_9MICO|nr:FAD-dependent oxidoreductase [Phycicoccus avicenniae]MBR7742695.1 FAD-dependent oxidoreductase [Phycicoccus avicenniae]
MSTSRLTPRFVVVGGGPAAGAAARRFAEAGEAVAVLADEPLAPYDRTVLSKGVLLDPAAPVPEVWPPDAGWRERIFVRRSTPVVALDPGRGVLTTEDGTTWAFDAVVLAPGAAARRLAVAGADGPGVLHLRDAADAARVSASLTEGSRLVVVGGGVIGLEVAAAARQRGVEVDVVEADPRVLGRVAPPAVADWLTRLHERNGVRVHTGVTPQEVLRDDGAVRGVHLSDDRVLPAHTVVVGIGVRPRTDLAEAAGLIVDDGIVVDPSMRTSRPAVLAAGDAVRVRGPGGSRGVRLESFTAAGRQGEVAAAVALGEDDAFTDVPWSWSDQYDASMQSMGVPPVDAEHVLLGDADAPFVLSLVGDRPVAACGVTTGPGIARPVRAAGPVIAHGVPLDVSALRAVGGDLAALARLLREASRG